MTVSGMANVVSAPKLNVESLKVVTTTFPAGITIS
jgi:hypothetical protein